MNGHKANLVVRKGAGFSLIELLVVIAIIGVLAALTVGAFVLIPERTRHQGTEALIRKIDAKLGHLLDDFARGSEAITVLGIDGNMDGSGNAARAKIIAVTRAMRHSFPERFYVDDNRESDMKDNDRDSIMDWPTDLDEALVADWSPIDTDSDGTAEINAVPVPATAVAHMRYMERAYYQNKAAFQALHTPPSGFAFSPRSTMRAACLFMIVTRGGAETEEFNADEMKDTDEDGLMEFVDKWGNPIQFFLFPSHYDSPFQRPGAETNLRDPYQLLTDPDPDPATTGDQSWWFTSSSTFESLFHSLRKASSQLTVPPTTGVEGVRCGYRMRPLIISAGGDQGFGMLTADPGGDGVMGTFDDIGVVDRRAWRINNTTQDGYGMDSDNIDNHSVRAR